MLYKLYNKNDINKRNNNNSRNSQNDQKQLKAFTGHTLEAKIHNTSQRVVNRKVVYLTYFNPKNSQNPIFSSRKIKKICEFCELALKNYF